MNQFVADATTVICPLCEQVGFHGDSMDKCIGALRETLDRERAARRAWQVALPPPEPDTPTRPPQIVIRFLRLVHGQPFIERCRTVHTLDQALAWIATDRTRKAATNRRYYLDTRTQRARYITPRQPRPQPRSALVVPVPDPAAVDVLVEDVLRLSRAHATVRSALAIT